jgi:hypothetical protein
MEMLSRARIEELERREQDEERAATAIVAAPQAPAAAIPVAAPAITSPAVIVPAPNAPAAPVVKQKSADASAKSADTPAPAPPTAVAPTPSAAPSAAAPEVTSAKTANVPPADDAQAEAQSKSQDPRATLLLSLATDSPDAPATADPIVCLGDMCWLSNGLEAPARPMSRGQALALKSTRSSTDDSCFGKGACAFRNIPVRAGSLVEVIEIGAAANSSSNPYSIGIDGSCRVDQGDLVCNNSLETRDYRLWVVPEKTANTAGANALENALADDLEGDDAQSSNDK